MRLSRRRFLYLSALGAVGLTTACTPSTSAPSGGAQAPSSPAQLLEQATKEGQVTVYHVASTEQIQPLLDMFTQKTGIKTELMRAGTAQVYQRFLQEFDAGINTADIVSTSDEAQFVDLKKRGTLMKYTSTEDDKYEARFKDKDGYYYHQYVDLLGMAYNPNLVKPEEVPKKFTDLLEPKWKGRLVQSHPGYSGHILSHVIAVVNIYGWDYYQKLARNEPLIVQSIVESVPRVVSGERHVAASMNTSQPVLAKQKGNPFVGVYAEEGVPVSQNVMAIAKNAPHPNAAKVFLDFAMGKEGQEWAHAYGLTSMRSDATLPADRTPIKNLKLIVYDGEEYAKKTQEVKDKFREIFGI